MNDFKASHALVILASIFALVPGEANAGFVWTINDNAGTSVSLDDTGSPGEIDFNGTVGAYTVSGSAFSNRAVATSQGVMHFSPLHVTTSGAVAAPLTIKLSETDFPSSSANMDTTFWNGLIDNGSVTGNAYFDPANIDFGTGGLHIAMGTYTNSPPATDPTDINFNSGFMDFEPGSVPYSEFIQLDVTATGVLNLDLTAAGVTQQVPEPSGFVIAGIGGVLVALNVIFRQRPTIAAIK